METEGGEQEILLQGEPINIHYGQVDDVLVDGESVVEDYIARISLRTVNDLINYYKKSETYTQSEINNLIGQIQTAHFEIVQELPETGEDNVIYLVPRTEEEENNIYDEYIWVNNSWEKIGSTEMPILNIQDGSGTKSLQQVDNQALGTSSMAVGEGTVATGKWAFAEGRGNNFEVTCLTTISGPLSYIVVSGDKADEIRKNAVIFYNDSFRYVTKVENYYLLIPQQAQAPIFEPNKYYQEEGQGNYEVLETEPIGWEYNYINYYYIAGYSLTLNDTITSTEGDTVKVFMGAALASNSHSSGTFCNTVYLGSTTLTDEDEVQRNSAEGSRTLATGYAAKAIGEYTRALGRRSFAEGNGSIAEGSDSVALNHETTATARYSTAMGDGTIAGCQGGLAVGRYNAGSGSAVFEVGNGTTSARHTAFEVNTNGKAYSYSEPTTSDSDNVVLNIKGLKNFVAIQKELKTQSEVDLAFGAGFYKVMNVSSMPVNYGELLSIPYTGGNGITQYGAQIFFPNGDNSANKDFFWYRTCIRATKSGDVIIPEWNNWVKVDKPTTINGLSGGTLTSPLIISGGDSSSSSKLSINQTTAGQITDNGTKTIFGFASNGTSNLTVGHKGYALQLRGSANRPQYSKDNSNFSDIALLNDLNGKLDTSKVKNTNSTTAGDVYDVRYINTMIGDVETILTTLTTGSGV